MSLTPSKTAEEWEQHLGAQIRAVRIRERLAQQDLATRANVSVGAIKNLEGGKGSSLKTLVKVLRALRRTDFLDALQPRVSVSPLDVARTGRSEPPSRVVHRKH
jgi:transcriptional regulator with XRE-family HTH domain